MKRSILMLSVAVTLLSAPALLSQPDPAAPLPAEAKLKALKEANAQLLEKQRATLIRLDALVKEAEQLRIFAKRS
jgi:hypothetical protein